MWGAIKDWASGVQDRMAGQSSPMSGFMNLPQYNNGSLRSGMMNGGDPSLMGAFNRIKGMFSPQMQGPAGIKYQRNVAPPNYGANSPIPRGDMRQTMASPYSPTRMNNSSVGDYYGY